MIKNGLILTNKFVETSLNQYNNDKHNSYKPIYNVLWFYKYDASFSY